MDPDVVDLVRPLLVMGGAVALVMLCRELHLGWVEAVTLRQTRQGTQDRQKPSHEEKETDEE